LKAQRNTPSYDDFLSEVLQTEIDGRDEKQVVIRMRLAKLPVEHNLDLYDQLKYQLDEMYIMADMVLTSYMSQKMLREWRRKSGR